MSAREQLAEVFTALWEQEAGEPLDELDVFAEARDHYVDALLPVVERIADERAAEALEKAATDAHANAYTERELPWTVIRNHAAALRAAS